MSYIDIEQLTRREKQNHRNQNQFETNYNIKSNILAFNQDYYYTDMMSDSEADDIIVDDGSIRDDDDGIIDSPSDEEQFSDEDHEEIDLGSDNDTIINQQPCYMDVTAEIKVDKKVSTNDFKPISVLGKGGFGTVLLVKKISGKDADKIYAMKIVKKVTILRSEKDTTHTKAERSILEVVDHPFIVKMQYAFQSPGKLFLVLEFAQGGELFSLLERQRVFSEEWAAFYLAEIALALGYLHKFKVIYRDLKPENVLLATDGHVKLTDFGLCKQEVQPEDKALTFCGTVEYMAPEVIRQRGHNKEVDWWSFGTLMYDMINGSPPFQGENREDTIKKVTTGRLTLYTHMSRNSKDLVVKLLQRSPSRRLGSGESDVDSVLSHSFFRQIDRNMLLNKEIEPPFVPNINSDIDHSLFDEKFTKMDISSSPEIIPTHDAISDDFFGFTYVHPSIVQSFNRYSEFDQYGVYNRHKKNEIVGSLTRELENSFNKSSCGMRGHGSNLVDNRNGSFDKRNDEWGIKYQNNHKYDIIDKHTINHNKNGYQTHPNFQNCPQQFNAINLKPNQIPQNPNLINSELSSYINNTTNNIDFNVHHQNLSYQNNTVPHRLNQVFKEYPNENNIRIDNRKDNFRNLNNFTKQGTINYKGNHMGDSVPIDIKNQFSSIKKNGKKDENDGRRKNGKKEENFDRRK